MTMNEAHFGEIERLILVVSDARERAQRVARDLERDDAEPHLVAAVAEVEKELDQVSHRLMRKTYFAVPKEQLTIS
jgi:uncharacterized protein Yka (UPF0111/DUF47 family)